MASLTKNFVSLVALGSQNPQIINVDFLFKHSIVPIDKEPYKTLSKQEKPFSKFISTPPLSNLVLGQIEFVVEEQRFQVRETNISEWNETIVFTIAHEYFKVLPYTPVRIAGINFNETISFSDSNEEKSFQELFLPKSCGVFKVISKSSDNINASSTLRFPFPKRDGRIMLTIDRSNEEHLKRNINFNYEFDCFSKTETDWDKFNSEINSASELFDYMDSLIDDLVKA